VHEAADDPEATAMAFVDCVNRGDVDGLARLMTEDHVLRVRSWTITADRRAVRDAYRRGA